jgi:magnesium transporter
MGYYRAGRAVPHAEVDALVGAPADGTLADLLASLHDDARRDPDGAFVWIGLIEPTLAELRTVESVFGLERLQVDDAKNPMQRAKFDLEKDRAFVLLKVLAYIDSTSDVETGQIAVFVGPGYVVTVRHGEHGDLRGVRDRLEQTPDLLRHGPVCVLHAVVDAVVDDYLVVADEISDDIEGVEEQVFSPVRSDDTVTIYRLKRENLEMRRAVGPMVGVAHDLVAETVEQIPAELRPYFRDVGDHVLRVNDLVESNDSLLLTMLMASTARQDLQQNSDMRKISAWVAIAAVPTMVAGIYGMNFDVMPELHSAWGYPLVMGFLVVVAVLMYRGFKRSGWL